MFPQILKTVNLKPVTATGPVLRDIACKHLEEHWSLKGKAPFTWLVAGGSLVTFIDTPWENDSEKFRAVETMRGMMQEEIFTAYAHTVEAWIAAFHSDKMTAAEQKYWLDWSAEHGVRNLPPHLREDIAMVMCFERGDNTAYCSRYLVTDRKGRGPNILGPRVDEDQMEMSGRMGNLFIKRRTVDESLAVAMAAMAAGAKKVTEK